MWQIKNKHYDNTHVYNVGSNSSADFKDLNGLNLVNLQGKLIHMGRIKNKPVLGAS